ncbi:MAG: transglutaminase family protein [Bacteroidota bacterium]|nr:transglutaminase family protein [Bacteroidota bacterium]
MNENKLDLLITLLDDPDDSVFQPVLEEILKADISVVDHLEHIWETSLDDLVQKRIELIIQQIQFNDAKKKIKSWANEQTIDLFDGFFLISRHQFPELKLKSVQVQLDNIRKDIWLEFRNSLTSLEKITILNHIVFDHYRFKIDRKNPDSPNLCYINRILESRKGNPVSLTILYTLIARSLKLPVHYIDIPNGPLVGYFDQAIARLAHGDDYGNSVLFYINPSNKGAIIGPREVDYIQPVREMTNRAKLTEPCADRIVIKRLLEKLIFAYSQAGATDKVSDLSKIAGIL